MLYVQQLLDIAAANRSTVLTNQLRLHDLRATFCSWSSSCVHSALMLASIIAVLCQPQLLPQQWGVGSLQHLLKCRKQHRCCRRLNIVWGVY